MDVLTQVLGTVRMSGAIFFELECRSPWGFLVPSAEVAAQLLPPGPERIVQFHWVTEGEADVCLFDGTTLVARSGDVVVLPRGDAHQVSRGSPETYVQATGGREAISAGRPGKAAIGGGGDLTRIMCGFMRCEQEADELFLRGLPAAFSVDLRDDVVGGWLETAAKELGEATSTDPGAAVLAARLAEMLLVAALRRYASGLNGGQGVWLAGASDRLVGRALSLLHADLARPWTLEELAACTGTSRSVLGQRFKQYLGEAPMHYLTRRRMQLAARLLRQTDCNIARIAEVAGYQSEAAFHRAFRRWRGKPPAAYRRDRRADC